MEKNKRKFFIGKFPGKQGRKWEQERLLETNAREIHRGTNARKAKRALGVLLAAALVFQTLPFGSAAASASEGRGGLCEHHRSHTPDCGYREAEPGAECTHEHTEDCYKTVEDCIHEHTESCYPADTVSESEGAPADVGERQPTECSHSCSEESGCITKELDCRHEHDGSCGYTEGMPGSPCTFVCEICNGGTPEDDGNDSETGGETKEPDQEAEEKPDDGQEECICEKPCKEDSINQECPVCGAEDADLSECKGKDAEEDTQKPEDTGICKHHQAHDESCGYQPASEDGEGSPCTYDCRICPIEELIAALPEVGSITEENGSEVRAQLDQILALFAELTGEEQEQLDLSRCYELQEALDGANAPDPAAEEDGPAQIKMEVKGVTTYLTGDQLKEALGANQNKGATFTLLDDVKLPDGVSLFTHAGGDITLDCGSYTLSGNCESSALVYVNRDSLTLKGGTLKNTDPTGCCVAVSSKFGQFRMEGGTLLPEGGSGHAIEVYGSVTVTGGSVGESGKGLNLYSSGTATLSGGTFGDIHAENGLSSILAEGYAFCRDGKPVALTLDQKDIEGPVSVVKCTHPDTTAPQDKGDGTHSLSACLACGKSDGAEAHDWTENRLTCTVCGAAAVARMEPDGTLLTEAQLEATLNTVNGIYTLTLLRDLERSERLVVGQYVTCTLDLNGHTIRMTGSGMAIYTYGDSNVTIRGTGEIISVNSNALTVLGTATLEGGTYSGGTAAIAIASQSSSLTLGDLLGHSGDTRYAYFDESGAPLTGVLGDQSLTGTVTVKKCEHDKSVCAYTPNEDADTHAMTCLACGLEGAAESCQLTYTSNETQHTAACETCGRTRTEAHSYGSWTPQHSATTVTIQRICESCKYTKTDGTFTVPAPGQTMQYGKPITLTCSSTLPDATFQWILRSFNDMSTVQESTGASFTPSETLAVGEYRWDARVTWTGSDGETMTKSDYLSVLPAPLSNVNVTLSPASAVYNGTAQKPAVTISGLIEGVDYTVAYTGDFTNAGKHTVTVTGKGNYTGTVTKEYAISKADVPAGNLAYTPPADLLYTGQSKTAAVTVNNLTGIGTVTVKYKKDNSGDLLAEAKEPGTYHVYADISVGQNYNATQIEMDSFTISYMDSPAVILYNGEAAKGWYNGDVVITADGYTVSDTLGEEYKDSYTISAQEGTVAKTLYFKDAAGHMSGGVEVTVKFDLTPPTGEIAVGAKWWQNVLHFISFGNYAAKEYTVTIKAEDKKGSGISKIEYAIVTGGSQYTDADTLKAANLSWKEYNSGSRPTVPVSNSQYVVYARLTDNVGNVTYISTDGILLDNTPPTVGSLSVPEDTRKDVTAGFTFTVSEAADYYYVVLPKDSAAPDPEDIIVTCGGTLPEGTGTAISGTFPKGSGAVSADTLPASVSVEAENLSPNTAYTVYVTAVDRAVDITDSAEGTPAGNIAAVQNVDFTTKKTLPVITKAPAVAGTYGQSVGEMTVTGGTAQAGSTVLVGTWTVSDADKNEKPSAGTSEVTVIFKPDNANYDSVSVQASLTVSQRNLNAEGVTVSEVAGTYTYTGSEIRPPVAVGTGTPAAGIYISDSGAALTASDFTVSYSNHKDAGTASVTITGKGNYTGSVTRTFTIGKAPGREVPDVSGSYTDNGQTYTYTVTPTEGAVYRMGNDGKWQEENVFEGITPGTSVTFYAKMPETGNYEDGTPKSITVDFPKLTPAAPALSYKADRTNPADVKVTITPVSGAEYSFDGGKTWTESNEQGGFTTSQTVVLAIRLKETDTHNQSPVQTVTVNLAKKDREAPPAFSLKVEANGETDYTVTIPATEGCEYSFDGEHWSDVNVKTGVSVGETVTGYKRYKETNDYNASSAVSAKETMPKFTVKTPVISPAGGSYTGNVSVTITCASPDAEIYYTTDGSAPGRGSTRYTGAFTVTAPATVKAIAVKEGLTDSAEASVTYTKKSDSGSGSGGNGGGNSGGNEDNGGQGSGGGGSTNPGNGSTTPPIPVIPPAENINPGNGATPGTGTTPVNPGTENTVRPGSGAGTPVQGTKQPFIKGEDGKIGWNVIRAEEEKAEEGSVINVDMNGSTVVPGDIFDSIKGKDITITFDMGNGIIWSVDGKCITADKAGDIDFSVKTGVNTVPVDIVNNVTGESYSIQISLAYEGEFGFTAVLSIGLGRENAGYTASLYYYNESTGELEFICKDQIAEDGTVSLAFTHASDYVIAIDGDGEEGSSTIEALKTDIGNTPTEVADTGVKDNMWNRVWRIVAGIVIIILSLGIYFIVKRKKGEEG